MNEPVSSGMHLAVCSWSLQPTHPEDLVGKLQATGLQRIQLALDPLREDPATWDHTGERLAEANMQVVSGMCTSVGEDYTTLDTIRATGGIVPDATWERNWSNMQKAAAIAARLQLRLVTLHAGFVPHDREDERYRNVKHRLQLLADLFADHGIDLALETGQETATTLDTFLQDLNRSTVGVNFDPANMILYDKGDPIEALRLLGPRLRQIHIKDARRTECAGTWGTEVPVGQGDVDWPACFEALHDAGFNGNCCIEREWGDERLEDIRAAHRHTAPLLHRYGTT